MSDEITTEKEHHLYGGSSASTWTNCYGWASLVSTIPHTPAGKKAARGTVLHKGILEYKVQSEIDKLLTGESKPYDYDDIPDWPPEGAELAEGFWKEIWVNVYEEFITGKQTYIEKKLMLFPDKDAGGTADMIVLYHNDKAEMVGCVVDYKSGEIRVEPNEEQLKFYLTALYLRLKEKGVELDKFKAVIMQDSHDEFYTEHWFTKKQILKAVKTYEKAIYESKKENPKFKVGEWCRYCKAKAICVKYNKSQKENLAMVMQENTLPTPEQLPDEAVVKLYLASKMISDYISANKKYVVARFANGQPLEGLKLVDGKGGNRQWVNEEEAVKVLGELGVTAQVVKTEMLGFPAIEKELKALGHKPKDVGVILAPFFTKSPPHPKITIASDPKPDFVFQDGASLLRLSDDSD